MFLFHLNMVQTSSNSLPYRSFFTHCKPMKIKSFFLQHVELSTLDAPNDEAAEKVMARFMEPPNPLDADDPTLPRVATANHNGTHTDVLTE